MFNKFAKNILIEVADDCLISSVKDTNKKELKSIANRISVIANKLVEAEVLAMIEEHD